MNVFPDDSTGQALRGLAADGDQLSVPRNVDFEHVFPNEEKALEFSRAVSTLGYDKIACVYSKKRGDWDARVSTTITPLYEVVARVEKELNLVAQQFSGKSDGWGCFSMKPEKPNQMPEPTPPSGASSND